MKISTEMTTTFEDFLKDIFKALISLVIAIITPVKGLLIFLLIAFTFNIIMGIRADKVVNKNPFSIDKFSKGFRLALLFSGIVLFISVFMVLLSEHDLGTMAIRWLSLFLFWGYSLNIVKNALAMHPENKVLFVLHQILSTDIFDYIMGMFGFKNKNYENKQ